MPKVASSNRRSRRQATSARRRSRTVTARVTFTNSTPFIFHNITSQDLMLGLRWNIGEPMGPLMRKG